MPITLNWVDNNSIIDKFLVYRSDAPFAESALPPVLAEVPYTARSYLDATAVRNKTYYYRIGHQIAGELTLSEQKILAFMPYTGPGPQTLLRGTWDAGYFGRVNIEELFSPLELLNMVGLNPAWVPAAAYVATVWFKFVYKGKILFWPDHSMANGTYVGFQQLYQLGLVYGNRPQSDWSAWVKTNLGTVAQGVTVRRKDDTFMVRLPYNREPFTGTGTTATDYAQGEIDQILTSVYSGRSLPTSLSTVVPARYFDDFTNANVWITQDSTNATGNPIVARQGPETINQYSTAISLGAGVEWRPVLELQF